ncbi:MAG: hypothetical protein M3O35_10915 [Acidobacteriota bacterium]|nr:hypothetical protein [Acidobacteriota bacterium]
MKPARFLGGSFLAAVLLGCCLSAPASADVSITVDELGNGTLVGPAGTFQLPVSTGQDPGPGGLASVLAFDLKNPPSLVFGDVQLIGAEGVSDVIRFNPAGRGGPSYPASLLYYSGGNDGAAHLVNTPTPPSAYYPNVINIPEGTVYTPGPGQPGYVAGIVTHYTFLRGVCTYVLSSNGQSFTSAGGNGSFTVTVNSGCPIAPVNNSGFITFSVSGNTVNFTVAPNSSVQSRTGTITVSDQTFTVTQGAGVLTIQPQRLVFLSDTITAPPPQQVSISGGDGSLFDVSVDVPWAKVSRDSSILPANITVSVSPATLKPGDYTGTITVNVGGSVSFITIRYTVFGLSLLPSPTQLTFNYVLGGPAPPSQQLTINAQNAVAIQAAGAPNSFVTVTPSSGTTPVVLNVSVDPTKVSGTGTFTSSVVITGPNSVSNSPLSVLVTLIVTSPGPQFTAAGVVNAASNVAGPLAPGSLFTIYGMNLSNVTLSAGPLPPTLDGVSITIGGFTAPIQYVSPTQVNAQVPFEVGLGQQTLIFKGSGGTVTIQVTIVPAQPGIFLVNGRGAILNQDNSLNTATNPAILNSVVQVFFTGQGLVTPPVATGQPASLTTLMFTNLPTTATIGGAPATVAFSGLAPGFVGLGQANIVVPTLATTKDYTLILSVNGQPSNGVAVAVKVQ